MILRRYDTRTRCGLTLIEVLVTVAIIALLIGFLMPAVQSVRAAASRINCVNNIRQMSLGTQHYIATWNTLPSGGFGGALDNSSGRGNHFSLHCLLLESLDQQPLYNQINFSLSGTVYSDISVENTTVRDTSLSMFLCPSDPSRSIRGASSYRGNAGIHFSRTQSVQGAFETGGVTKPADFRDGLSNTILFAEKPISRPGHYHPYTGWYDITRMSVYSDAFAWREACQRQYNAESTHSDAGTTWLVGGAIYTLFYVAETPNSRIPDCGVADFSGIGIFTARSYHNNGVNVGVADGSVRWMSTSVERNYWHSLGTRAGGEIVNNN